MEIIKNAKLEQLMRHFSLEVVESGFASVGTDWSCRDTCAPFSRIYYILEGEGEIRIGEERIRLREGHCYLVPTGLVYDYVCPASMKQIYFHVNASMSDGLDLFEGYGTCWCGEAEPGTGQKLQRLYEKKDWNAALWIEAELLDVIRRAAEGFREQEGGTGEPAAMRVYSDLLQRMFVLARNPVSARNTVKNLAERLHVSESTLSKRFREETGRTAGSYLDELLHRQCSRLLLSSELSMAEIAEQLGFSDPFYFSRFFKKKQGETPSGYRRRLKTIWFEKKMIREN